MNKGNEKNLKEKQLMFCLSKWLSREEAYALAKSMRTPDKWSIYKIAENPNARHIRESESWVVVRPFRKGEAVRAGEGIFEEKNLDYML
ncbi:MAG TPA: hypothetical protein VMF88_00850 [Bacteroidota bacterium]|nr:hypothetical protein [Bacteroidota bacterium]